MAETPSELHAEIEHLERKHADNPDGRFFVPLANAYRKLGELDRAETLLREGIERHSDYLSARIVLARCLADRGDAEGASTEFERVLRIDPQNLIALRTLGEIAMAAGRPDEAERWFRDLLSVDPMNDEARRALDEIEATGGATHGSPEPGSWWDPGDDGSSDALEPAAADDGSAAPATEFVEAPRSGADLHGESDDELADWEEPEQVRSVEVVTETIAELYARQELYERAAEVYRELIRRRGGDPALESRLAEVEALARGESFMVQESDASPAVGAAPDGDGIPGVVDEAPHAAAPGETDEAVPTPSIDPIDSWNLPDDRPAYTLDLEPSEHAASEDAPATEDDAFAASFAAGFVDGPEPLASGGLPPLEEEALAEFEFAPEPTDAGAAYDATSGPAADLGTVPDEAFLGAPDSSAAADASSPATSEASESPQPLTPRDPGRADRQGPDRPGRTETIAEYLRTLSEWRPSNGGASVDPPDPETGGQLPAAPDAAREDASPGVGTRQDTLMERAAEETRPEIAGALSETDPRSSEGDDPDPVFGLDDYFSDSAPTPLPAPVEDSPGASSSERDEESEDDDLESFQAWLRSLKR